MLVRDGEESGLGEELILPDQFFPALRHQLPQQGERRLMAEVFADALMCVGGYAKRSEREIEEARDWFLSLENQNHPYSLTSVCQYLDIDADFIRDKMSRIIAASGRIALKRNKVPRKAVLEVAR